MMAALPSGTVTFLFSDIAGSTTLVKELRDEYESVLATHRDLLRRVFRANGGLEVDTQGDSFFVVFERARDAVMAAADSQRQMSAHRWPHQSSVCVRMGLHTGEPYLGQHGYTGVAVHRAARLCSLAHGGQVLLSRSTAGILDDDDLRSLTVRDLGEHGLKDFEHPERIYQLVGHGLPSEFPPLRSIDHQRPLTGTVTLVMCEGRRVMRLHKELPPEHFGELLDAYQRLLRRLFEEMGGREIETTLDTATAAFPSAKQAALAAVAAQRATSAHEWPYGMKLSISVGLHSGEAGVGWVGPAVGRCMELCDTAEGGQIVMSEATAALLDDEDLGGLSVRDLGNQSARRTDSVAQVYELA
jgi:class 3 adenylate cyclase